MNNVVANNAAMNNVVANNNVANLISVNNVVEDTSCGGLLYSNDEQLRKAQDRRVMCNGSPNVLPVQGYEGVQSAQGYGSESQVSGFNESGHSSINYLCLGNNN